jgi:hypothetical protein
MKSLAIALLFSVVTMGSASARSSARRAPSPVQSELVERRVANLSTLRFSPAFDNSFSEVVGLIKTLYGQRATDKVDAQDYAMSAFNAYMDHHHIVLDTEGDARTAKARQAAAQAGLLEVLGW